MFAKNVTILVNSAMDRRGIIALRAMRRLGISICSKKNKCARVKSHFSWIHIHGIVNLSYQKQLIRGWIIRISVIS